jgi:hypothetical protein
MTDIKVLAFCLIAFAAGAISEHRYMAKKQTEMYTECLETTALAMSGWLACETRPKD